MTSRASSQQESQDKTYMARALALARRGQGLASPNPMVGAVLVRNGRVVGQGFHTYNELCHAEINALKDVGSAARGATLYVSLEPCCITRRTPPCTSAIIAAGVKRVVAAMPDPNPVVAGRGFRQLRAAGIAVKVGEGREDARVLNEAFAKWIRTRLPFVTLKSALTLDGHLVLPASSQQSRSKRRWITSPASRAEVHRMRHASDALLTGIGTVLADNSLLTDRSGLPRRRRLLRVILDSRLRLDARSRLVRSAQDDVLVFTCADASGTRGQALRRAGLEVFEFRTDRTKGKRARIDLKAVLAELGRRQILSVLLEAGATLNQAALAANLVDKVRLFYSPKVAFPARSFPLRKPRNAEHDATGGRELSRVKIEKVGSDFSVEGYLRDVYRR